MKQKLLNRNMKKEKFSKKEECDVGKMQTKIEKRKNRENRIYL